jgi:hypothetical protein
MKRHRLDSTSLVAGMLFVLVAGTYLLSQRYDWSIDARWVLPLVLVGLGLAGLAGAVQSLTSSSRDRAPEDLAIRSTVDPDGSAAGDAEATEDTIGVAARTDVERGPTEADSSAS